MNRLLMNTVMFPLKREHSKFTNQRDIDNIIAAKKRRQNDKKRTTNLHTFYLKIELIERLSNTNYITKIGYSLVAQKRPQSCTTRGTHHVVLVVDTFDNKSHSMTVQLRYHIIITLHKHIYHGINTVGNVSCSVLWGLFCICTVSYKCTLVCTRLFL